MKAVTSNNKPTLLKQTDIVSFYHIQMPRWLFADKRYNRISLAAKVAYSLLLNRHQLSKLNGWVNEDGEVFVIFSRDELAGELQVGSNKAISVFKELVDIGLVWEKRRGNNLPNHIYLTRVELSDEDAADYDNTPFRPMPVVADDEPGSLDFTCPDYSSDYECADNTEEITACDILGHAENKPPEAQEQDVWTFNFQMSGGAENKGLDMGKSNPSYTYSSQKDKSYIELSQSVGHAHPRTRDCPNRRTDDEIAELDEILERCDLWTFLPTTAKVFESAIERLFFSESFRIGNSVLPQRKVRSHLHELDQIKLQTAEQKISRNTEKEIRNTTAYTMAVIFNSIWETDSDVMNDPYLNSLRGGVTPGSEKSG